MQNTFLLLLTLAGLSATASAEEIPLFNGSDFSGWAFILDRQGPNADGRMNIDDLWSIKGNVVRCDGLVGAYGYIRTLEDYTNYRLRLEWRWVDTNPKTRNNSGVFVRLGVPDRWEPRNNIWPTTYELQLVPGDTGDIWIIGGRNVGSFVSDPARIFPATDVMLKAGLQHARRLRSKNMERPLGDWNQYDITVKDDHIVVRVNGELVNEGSGAEILPGKIGLQCENSPIEFRNVLLTKLRD